MSRHVIAEEPEQIVVGWDPPLETYFLQVYDSNEEEDDDSLKVWLGTNQREMTTVEALEDALATYTNVEKLTDEQFDLLESDRINSLKPSPLQERMIAMFGRKR